MRLATLATCQLNQWAMDLSGNLARTKLSIEQARQKGARYRLGPELETTGYGCADHFLERDLVHHSWEVIASLISSGYTDSILVDIGAPVLHRGLVYNCRVLLLNRTVLLVRPKADLAAYGNFFETRYFTAWPRQRPVEQFLFPLCIRNVTSGSATSCAIGQGIIEFQDGVTVGCETCEELWTPITSHVLLGLHGVDVIGNGSGSHHQLRKFQERVSLITHATKVNGGAYLYSNQQGCDGDRLYYDGSALIATNGMVLQHAGQFSLKREVKVITAVVDIDDISSFRRTHPARGVQAAFGMQGQAEVHRVQVNSDFSICDEGSGARRLSPTLAIDQVPYCTPEEEIAQGPACWLWDYLRRSGLNGFFLPLSGGADSAASATIIGSMCQMLVKAVNDDDAEQERLLGEIRHVTGTGAEYFPTDPRELAGRLFRTVYMGHGETSSKETRARAERIAEDIGAVHHSVEIDGVVESCLKVFESVFGDKKPRFRAYGGGLAENLGLQCLQARVRMVVGYLYAQLCLWAEGRNGALLVVGSANVDEGLRGYLTKYDCSSADVNPIGGISKNDLKSFLKWASKKEKGLGYESLSEVLEARPSAELEPIVNGHVQTDEEDMGMTYEELSLFGRLRKIERCGPFAMYEKLVDLWGRRISIREVANKVKFFFRMYGINRHKLSVLTPSYFAVDYSPDDNRFDMRQLLYNVKWLWQFKSIDEDVDERMNAAKQE